MAMFQPDINAQTATSLRDIVGGGTAMQYISEQNDMRRRMNPINENLSLADLERMNLANDRSRTMNPLDATVRGAEAREAAGKDDVYFTGMRQGDLAKARKTGIEADIMAGTKDATIKGTNDELAAKQRAMIGKEISDRAVWMAQSLPPTEYAAALTKFAAEIPGMTESPQFQALVKQSPEKILQFMQKMGDTLRAADPALRNADRISAEDNASKEKIAAGNNAATIGAANINADAKRKDVVNEARTLYMKGNPEGAVILSELAAQAGDMRAAADWKAKAVDLAKRRLKEREAGARVGDDFKRELTGVGGSNKTPSGIGYTVLPSD